MPTPSSRSAKLPVESLLTEVEALRFADWNATTQSYPREVCVPQLVSLQAAIHPHNRALVTRDGAVSYLELDQWTDRLARYLRSLGVGPSTLVGICLERSVGMVVGALSTLKAGGAYLPLDPTYPPERLSFLLNDAQAPVLLTQRDVTNRLPPGNWQIVNLELDALQNALHVPGSRNPDVSGEDLAYVIYTSGSTGRPKGVQITHDSLLNLVFWHQRTFDVKPRDRASQLASPGFDAAVWELWPYLTAGASVYLPSNSVRRDPESLRNWLIQERITIAFAPTPLAEGMMGLRWPSETALRTLLTGADTLHIYPSPNLPFRVINNYGPTECTVVACSGEVSPVDRPNILPAIGRPIANTQIYILDEQLRQVAVGVPGEIFIGGAGLARGYLNQRELTLEKFVPNPFNSDPSARLYKTGDLARYLPDGQIAFMGRTDDQIKIRGYRIEPNEIVIALAAHPMVQSSFVLAREDAPGDKRLVAYLVPTPGTHPTDKILREFLSRQLPDYMVPAIFVRVDALPVNASGKIDRSALPNPGDSNALEMDKHIAPRTPTEQRIAEILAPLLGVERVGVEDNFFMLGGHSLLGTQLIARTRDTFGVELSLRSLFDSPSIAALAAEVERLLYLRLEAMSEEEAEQSLKAAVRSSIGESPSGSYQ